MPRPKPTGDDELITTTMRLEKRRLNRVSYISWFDRRGSKKAVITDALDDYIAKWEKKNGPITETLISEMKKAKD